MNFAALEELEQFLTANPETQVLELLMPDLSGILRAKRIHRSEFERLFSGSFLTPRSAPLLGIRGDWYDEIPLAEMGGDPDQIIRPVAGTIALVSWYAAHPSSSSSSVRAALPFASWKKLYAMDRKE